MKSNRAVSLSCNRDTGQPADLFNLHSGHSDSTAAADQRGRAATVSNVVQASLICSITNSLKLTMCRVSLFCYFAFTKLKEILKLKLNPLSSDIRIVLFFCPRKTLRILVSATFRARSAIMLQQEYVVSLWEKRKYWLEVTRFSAKKCRRDPRSGRKRLMVHFLMLMKSKTCCLGFQKSILLPGSTTFCYRK